MKQRIICIWYTQRTCKQTEMIYVSYNRHPYKITNNECQGILNIHTKQREQCALFYIGYII